jgi:hypothetical protein
MTSAEHNKVMADHKELSALYTKALKYAEHNQAKSLKTKSVIMQ